MSVKEFRSIITQLWERRSIDPPSFQELDSVILSIDNIDIKLHENLGGKYIDVIGEVGPLSKDRDHMETQINDILITNLSTLMLNRTCVCLDKKTHHRMVLVCYGRYSYFSRNINFLERIIEEVLVATEYWRSALLQTKKPGLANTAEHSRIQHADSENTLLFHA